MDLIAADKVKAWTFDTQDEGKHTWGQETVRLEQRLPVGAYLLAAAGGGKTARELVLVTDVSIVVKAWSGQVLAYVCDALDGSPIPGARVHLWSCRYINDRWTGTDLISRTDDQGLVHFELEAVGRWLIKAVVMEPAIDDAEADWRSWWSSLTFDVSSR